MADYTINIGFEDNNAGRKLDELDKKVKEVTKPAKIKIELPDLDKAKRNLQELSKYSGLAVTAFKQFTPIGKTFAGVEDNVRALAGSLATVGRTLGGLSAYANPVRGLADGFSTVTGAVQGTIDTTARLGFAIFGVTQSVNILKAAFGQMFEDTVGREVKLREQILQTATTLAGTNRVFADGFEIKDPVAKLQALEGSVNKSIERIRDRSLEIAGTTSDAVISVFNVVASQIGSFGGTMRQAEDLAVKFSGALGTLGMSDPMYARQEIGSIMMGYVDQNSVLAKTIQISNPDIQKAKQQGQLYEYLSQKLAVFEAGQKTAAKAFRGVTSNIQELSEELKRSFGSSLLDPILARITGFYEKVSGKETLQKLKQTAQAFGQLVGGSLNSAVGTISGASIFQGIDSKGIQATADKLQAIFAKVATFIQEQLTRIAPAVQRIVDRVGQSVLTLGKAFASMAGTLARIKIDQLVVRLQALSALTPGIIAAASAYSNYLKTIEDIVNTPLGRYINELKEMNKILSEFGVFGIVNNIIAIRELKQQIPVLVSQIQAIGAALGQAAESSFNFVAGLYGKIATATTGFIAAIGTPLTSAFASISTGLARIAAQAAQLILTLSNTAVILGGEWSALSAPLARLANGLAGVALALQKAGQDATAFGQQMQAAMTNAQASTQNVSTAIAGLGTKLKTGVAAGATAVTGALTGMVRGILATMTTMALWTVGLTLVFDLVRRIGEWWERFSQRQEYRQAVDDLNSGLLAQVKAARDASKALDSVTDARKRLREEQLQESIKRDEEELKKYAQELYKRAKNISSLAKDPDEVRLSNEQIALKRDPAFAKAIKEIEDRLKNAKKLYNELTGAKDPNNQNDPQLRQQENRQAIEDLAKFEKDARRSIEDEIYNYRRQAQQKELDVWRTQGELRIQQIDQQNRRVIEGVDSEARESLEALNNWLTTKRQGELDIQVKQKEAQMAAVEVERAIGRFRLQLEQQVAEIRKRIQQYEIAVLDKRIQAEQLIANIRNNSIVSEPAGGGQFRVGSTGRSTGPHLDIRGENAEKVVEEALTIIKAWQKMGLEYIVLSNINANVKDITDDRRLRDYLRREQAIHSGRSHLNPIDIAVPAGTPLPVAHGPVTWGGKAEGYMARSVATGNLFLHGLKPDGIAPVNGASNYAGSSSGSKQEQAMRFFMSRGLTRMQAAALVGGLMQESQLDASAVNPKTGNEGIAQWGGSRKYTMVQAGARNSFSKQLEFIWSELMGGENNAYVALKNSKTLNQALLAAAKYERFHGHEAIGAGTEWGDRIKYTQQILASGVGSGGAAGSASLASIGGAPEKPNVTLNIDTSELDSAADRLNAANQALIELQKNQNAFKDAEGFNTFVKSLDTTSAELEKIDKQLVNQKINLEAVAKATEGGIFDPETLQLNIQHQQALTALEKLHQTRLAAVPKLKGATDEERRMATQKMNEAYAKDKRNLDSIYNKKLETLNLDKEAERLMKINDARRQSFGDFKTQEFRLQGEARSALLSPDDFAAIRREEALQTANARYLELTDNGTKPMSATVKAAFEKMREQLLESAGKLAELDKAIDQNRRIRELMNLTEQSRIDRLTSEASMRTEASKAAIDPANFLALRRLDAQQQVYGKYMELTNGDTKELTEDGRRELQRFAEQSITTADALAEVDTELQQFADRLALARESAQTLTNGYKTMVNSLMYGGNLKEALGQMGENVSSFFTNKLLDYAFKPLQDQLEKSFSWLFGADSAQVQNTSALEALTGAITKLHTALTTPITEIPDTPTTSSPLETAQAAQVATETAGQVGQSLQGISDETKKFSDNAKQNAKDTQDSTEVALSSMQKYTSGLAGVAASVLSIAGGIQMMRKGGTYNTLMGLAGIFGSIGSFAGLFGKGGIFTRASGGPVLTRSPYLVGEQGPELFMPDQSGTVIPNNRTRALLAARGALAPGGTPGSATPFDANREAIATAATITRERQTERTMAAVLAAPNKPIRFETTMINAVEFVTKAEAEEIGRLSERRGAERGQALALGALRSSVKTRRSVGM